jgi:CHAT domain-containing protein
MIGGFVKMPPLYFRQSPLICLVAILILAGVSRAQENPALTVAEKLQSEAESLFNKNTPEARAEARPKFVEALKLWRQTGDETRQILALNKLVDIHALSGDYAKALEYSEQLLPIARKSGEKNLEAGVLFNIGRYYDALGETRKGLDYAEKSVELLRQTGERQREGIALNSVGMMNYNLGEIQKALDIYHRVLALRREIGDRRGEAYTLINLAYADSDSGNKRKSIELYNQALKIALEIKDSRAESLIENNLASVWHDLGEYQKAFDWYQKSLARRRQEGDKYGEAMSLNNLAALYRDLGDFENALKFIGEAAAIYQTGGFRREIARTLASAGAIFAAQGEKDKALEYYRKAVALYGTLENKDGYATVLNNIGRIYFDRNQSPQAVEYFQSALRLAEEVGDVATSAEILIFQAQTYEQLKDARQAEVSFTRGLNILREIGAQPSLANALYYSAAFDERAGRRALAIEKMREVMQIINDLRNAITSENLRANYLSEQQKYYDFYISLLVAEHQLKPQKGFHIEALTISESARARSLLESLHESQTDIRAGVAPELLAREKILRRTINAKETQRLEAVSQKSAAKAAEFEKELAEAVRQYRELQTEIRRASPQFASLTTPELLDLKEIQTRVLDENSVLLEYFLGAERSFLFFVDKNSLEIFELPKRETIENQARRMLDNLKSRGQTVPGENLTRRAERLKKSDAEAKNHLAQLSKILLSPVAGKIQNRRLLIVSSGVLQYVPFAALTVRGQPRAVSRQQTGDRFLIETNEIVNLPSASVLPVLRENKTRPKQTKNLLAILADPVFSSDDARLKLLAKQSANRVSDAAAVTVMREAKIISPQLRSDFGRLRFSRVEAEAISNFAPNDQRLVAMDFGANLKTAAGENFQKSRILHLATHGVINSDFPELSGVVLSLVDENGRTQEGFWRLHDIYNLRLGADLVVLSACETALGKEIKGEGVVGLARGFMYAGAPAVVASLWRVEDKATAELMKRFYQKMLRENLPPAAALRAAQISMISDKTFAPPFYWAAFTLQGDWQ